MRKTIIEFEDVLWHVTPNGKRKAKRRNAPRYVKVRYTMKEIARELHIHYPKEENLHSRPDYNFFAIFAARAALDMAKWTFASKA